MSILLNYSLSGKTLRTVIIFILKRTNLIRAWVRDIDNSSSLFCLQVSDKTSFKSMGLVVDILLVQSTRQCQQKAVFIFSLEKKVFL